MSFISIKGVLDQRKMLIYLNNCTVDKIRIYHDSIKTLPVIVYIY